MQVIEKEKIISGTSIIINYEQSVCVCVGGGGGGGGLLTKKYAYSAVV